LLLADPASATFIENSTFGAIGQTKYISPYSIYETLIKKFISYLFSMHKLLQIQDRELLRRSLTHRSYINEHPQESGDNERLEFLGDAILNFISGEYLYLRYPDMAEGEMTRRRAALVDEKQLAKFAIAVGINHQMRLGHGVAQGGGNNNPNLLSSAFESVIGAYYLDADRQIATLRPLIEELFDSVPPAEMVARSNVDVKNRLQELLHSQGTTTPPRYQHYRSGGTDHAPEFIAQVYVGDKLYGTGQGRSTKIAEKQAAADALLKLEEDRSARSRNSVSELNIIDD
jgi:ribonuclease III